MMNITDLFLDYQSKGLLEQQKSLNHKELLSVIDLTLLDYNAPKHKLDEMKQLLSQHTLAAVCVFPKHLNFFDNIKHIKKATVVNFPEGNKSIHHVNLLLDSCFDNEKVDEIDYVFSYKNYLNGDKKVALKHLELCYEHCKKHHKLFKVIIETGAFQSLEEIYEVSKKIITIGCDFLKTSTGKINQGATLGAAFSILKAIKDLNRPIGIKISGGIQSYEDALPYIILSENMMGRNIDKSWFRIGASRLANDLVSQ